jgi:glycosyltransferase involved in cell wall biosynthesis
VTQKKPLRVLNVLIGYLPAVAWGGPITVVQQNAGALQRRGHQVSVCASNRLDRTRRLASGNSEGSVDGIPVVYLNTRVWQYWSGTVGPTLLSVSAIRRLWREVGAADVVHVHGSRNMIVLLAAVFAKMRSRALVVQPHGTAAQIVSSIRLKRILDPILVRPMLRWADAILALTPAEREQIIRGGADPERIRIVANGISVRKHTETDDVGFRERYNIPADRTLLLFLARINPKKGADILARAFTAVRPEVRKGLHLIIAGPDDGQLAEVQEIIRAAGLDGQVTYTGSLNREDVHAAHYHAHLFLLPCRTDTFPMAIIEACNAGTPIVISNTCEIAEIVAGKAGLSVEPEPRAVANAIETIVTTPALQDRFATGGAELVRTTFSIDAATDAMEEVYAGATA